MARQAVVERPTGRDQIVGAVVAAATTLFAERGPAAVSLRDVAGAASVTLSQIHRHIGNKEALLVAVLAAELDAGGPMATAETGDLTAVLQGFFQLQAPHVRTRLQARIVLDGFDLAALQTRFPGIERTTAALQEHLPEEQARVRAAVLATFFAGWQLLGPAYLRVTGADDVTPERFEAVIAPMLEALASAPPAD